MFDIARLLSDFKRDFELNFDKNIHAYGKYIRCFYELENKILEDLNSL